MTDIDHAIDNLINLVKCFAAQGNLQDAMRAQAELEGWLSVREGFAFDDSPYHHAELRYLYRQARHDAQALLQPQEEPCTKTTSNI